VVGYRNPELRSFAHYRTWSTLSRQRAEYSEEEPLVSAPRLKKLSRAEKKRLKKENPAGSPSSSSLQPVVKIRPERKPRPKLTIVEPPEPAVKIPGEKLLASVAKKYKIHDTKGYKRLQKSRKDPRALAANVVNSSFLPVLSKYKGYNHLQLMESVIVDYIRVERPEVEQTEEVQQGRRPKRALTPRQQLQAAHVAASRPAAPAAQAITRRGAAKTVPCREKYDDPQIVQDALDALFEDDQELKATFCAASLLEAKQLIRTHGRTEQLADKLRGRLASPTRVYNYLDTAVRVLIPKYVEEQTEAEQQARVAAEQRRREQIDTARTLAGRREQKRQEERRREVMRSSPSYWRDLRQA